MSYNGDMNEYTRLIRVWLGIWKRCYDPRDTGYKNYGGRGIYMCDEWLQSADAFAHWSIANGSARQYDGRSFHCDRIDNNGPYAPDNCRYISSAENNKNRRPSVSPLSVLVPAFGEEKTVAKWVKDPRCLVTSRCLRQRLDAGWNAERALTQWSRSGSALCPYGHEYTEENTYFRPKTGTKMCRTCHRERSNNRYHQSKKAA